MYNNNNNNYNYEVTELDLNAIVDKYADAFSNNEVYQDETVTYTITPNDRKAKRGTYSVSFEVSAGENKGTARCTLYIVAKKKGNNVLFVNDKSKDIIYNNFGEEALEKVQSYILSYFERSTKRMLGIEVEDYRPKKNFN